MTVRTRDFFKEPLSREELQSLLADHSPSELFSWKSPRAKALGLKEDEVPEDKLMQLMLEEPFLIRRPMIVIDSQLVVGFDRKLLEELLG